MTSLLMSICESNMDFVSDKFSLPPENLENLSRYDIFLKFWSDDIIEIIVEQTNQYTVLKNGKSVNTNFAKIEQFLGIQIMIGHVQMFSYTNYWAAEIRVNIIADTISRKQYKELRGSIHLVGNTLQDQNKQEKLFTIRLLLEMAWANCLKVEQEKVMPTDEQIIPSKTKKSGISQFNPKKSVK